MTITELLNKIHIRYEKNVDYPVSGSEDYLVRLAYVDDAIGTWEKEIFEGVIWESLKKDASITTDTLPTDFLDFVRADGEQAVIEQGNLVYTETTMEDGNRYTQDGSSPYVFWAENGKLKSLPTLSGTITFPYLRKATRYPLGTESTALDIKNPMFLQEFVLAMLFLDDGNLNQYNAHINVAEDILDTMRNEAIQKTKQEEFPIGL